MPYPCAGGCRTLLPINGQTCPACKTKQELQARLDRRVGAPVPSQGGASYICAGGCGAKVFVSGQTCSSCAVKQAVGGLKAAPVAVAVAPALMPGALPAGAVLGMKCRKNGELAWIDVVHNSTLYVLKGTSVELEATCTGGAPDLRALVRLDTAQWSGEGGPATSKNKIVGLNFNSASLAAPKSVTVTYGGQAVTVNFIVYTLNIVSTPDDNFVGRSQSDVGVGEIVHLSFNTVPAGITAANAGGLKWRFQNGTPNNRQTLGLLRKPAALTDPENTGLADFFAPVRTHAADAAFQTSVEVTVELMIVSGPSIGPAAEKTYRVHKPQAHMRRDAGQPLQHWNPPPGNSPVASAGFFGVIFFTPKEVSFRELRWREGTGVMKAWGKCTDGEVGMRHRPTAFGDAVHGTITDGDSNSGCTVNQLDNVRTGGSGGPIPFGASPTTPVGGKEWPIIWQYTYKELVGNTWKDDWIDMQKAIHKGVMYENGRFTQFKGHIGCVNCMKEISIDLDDPLHNWP